MIRTLPAVQHPAFQPTVARLRAESKAFIEAATRAGVPEKTRIWLAACHLKRQSKRLGLRDKYVPLSRQVTQ